MSRGSGAGKRGLCIALALAALPGCAKKMLPPSPDRFAPQLQEVLPKTRSQVVLVFDEELDGARLVLDSFQVTGAAGETLALRGVSLGRRGDEVQLWTHTQASKPYELRGRVWDAAGNPARFRARFQGSSRRDTIAPRVVRIEPSPGAARQKRGVIRVTFSEAVDTTKTPQYLFVPAAFDTEFKRSWTADWQTLSLVRPETLAGTEHIYFVVQPGVRDLEGNPTRGPAYTYFTSDSVFEAVPVKGKAIWGNEPLRTGVVLFHGHGPESDSLPADSVIPERTRGLAPVLSDGSFSTKVRKGKYEVVAVADTNQDGLVELASLPHEFNTDVESLTLTLRPDSLPKPPNAYRR